MSRRPPPAGREGGTRTARAVILLVVVVLVAVVLLGKLGTSKSTTVSAGAKPKTTPTTAGGQPTSTTSTTVPALPPAQVKLLVLNGTLSGNLAGSASKQLAASPGFTTLAPDNTTAKVLTSSVYAAAPRYLPSAQAIAAIYGIPATAVATPIPAAAPILPAERALADVVLVIGPETAGKVAAG